MANQFPEVLPEVQSMPTTGWFCQTSGNARKRVTKNTSMSDSQGVYDVKGVPKHTHNASAVVSVDADYTRYRESSITVPEHVWGYGLLEMPAGILTDSEEPDHAAERYDRAIEKCVGYISMFPENCTGHIREPTRSISEIRTLVAPKARLETLTYVDEMGGWRIPGDADDQKTEQEVLVSEFPDVRVSVLPRSQVQAANLNKDVSPGSLYIDFESALNQRYRVEATAEGIVAHVAGLAYREYETYKAARAAGGAGLTAAEEAELERLARWDNCLVFAWDPDKRTYRTRKEVTVVLQNVVAVYKATVGAEGQPGYQAAGADAGTAFDGADGAGHAGKLTVTFPVLETSAAFDGSCWFASIRNEEALGYAARNNGLTLAKPVSVDVLGAETVGPFTWTGMPAWRIPVGGKYAIPGPDILQELFGDGAAATDLQYNFYDQFRSLSWDGILRYQWRQQSAAIVDDANSTALTLSRLGLPVLSFAARAQHKNGGLFRNRPGGFQKDLFEKQLLRNYAASVVPYTGIANPAAADIITSGFRNVLYQYRTPARVVQDATAARDDTANAIGVHNARIAELQSENARNVVNGDKHIIAMNNVEITERRKDLVSLQTQLVEQEALLVLATAQAAATHIDPLRRDSNACFRASSTTFKGTCTFGFPVARFAAGDFPRFWAAGPSMRPESYNYVAVACTPLMFERGADGLIAAAKVAGASALTTGHHSIVPRVIMDINHISADGTVNCEYDFTNTLDDDFAARDSTNHNNDGHKFFTAGYSLWLSRLEGDKSNILANLVQNAHLLDGRTQQQVRDDYGARFVIGNLFPVPANKLLVSSADGTVTAFNIYNYLLATTTSIKGVFIRATQPHNGRIYMYYAPLLDEKTGRVLQYTTANAGEVDSQTRWIGIRTGQPKMYANGVLVDVTRALFDTVKGIQNQSFEMILLDKDFAEQNQTYDSEVGPFEEDVSYTQRVGAVFQSIKRISQHVCAPILNPNMRIGTVAPLNYDSRHLPPEMRDFRLQFYDIDWSRLQASKTSLNELTLYQFKDGNQKVGAETNVLYLPQFREFKRPVTDGSFEVEIFSELGAPSYFCFFCRSSSTDILQQPIIRTLSIYNGTTKKKSNVVQDLSVSQMFHLTQRNVHPQAQYDKDAFRRRQTVLLSTEDIGLLGLTHGEYQKPKRVRYMFSGTTDSVLGDLYIVLVYNNRGLHIDGRRLQVVTLHE